MNGIGDNTNTEQTHVALHLYILSYIYLKTNHLVSKKCCNKHLSGSPLTQKKYKPLK